MEGQGSDRRLLMDIADILFDFGINRMVGRFLKYLTGEKT